MVFRSFMGWWAMTKDMTVMTMTRTMTCSDLYNICKVFPIDFIAAPDPAT